VNMVAVAPPEQRYVTPAHSGEPAQAPTTRAACRPRWGISASRSGEFQLSAVSAGEVGTDQASTGLDIAQDAGLPPCPSSNSGAVSLVLTAPITALAYAASCWASHSFPLCVM
jgi:hypothetical protein